jgi:hypothetical protein
MTDDIHKSLQQIAEEVLNESYFSEDDEGNKHEYDDTRRPKLTLRHLNKLRKIQELKKLEDEAHSEFVKKMYGTPPEEGGAGPEF